MKNNIYSILFLLVCFGCLFYTCNTTDNNRLPNPELKCGVAKISGKFRGFNELRKYEEAHNIYCVLPKPLTGRNEKIKIEIKEDETFVLEIPIETSSTLGYMEFFSGDFFCFPLISDKETVFDFYYENGELHIEWRDGPNSLIGNAGAWYDALGDALEAEPLSLISLGQYNLDTLKRFIADPKEYIPYAIKYDLGNRLMLLENDKRLPKAALDMFSNEVRLMRIPQFIHFSGDIWNMYETYNRYDEIEAKNELDTATFLPPNPDISYWIFLKEFNLNDSHYLYTQKLFYILQMLLENKTLSIPPIGENSINEWLKLTKDILVDLVGFSDGIFYDILVCNAYSRQFVNRQAPLSNKQIENIRNYYKGGEVEKILLRENEKIAKLNDKRHLTVLNVTPNVEKEQLIDTIISKYKGKVIVLDFWATWCGPCMSAMTDMAEMKTSFIDKDIVFVYVTYESSPKHKWEEIVPGIGGEHYYLTLDEWEYVMNNFNSQSIPLYQFYDREGQLRNQITGFPGIDRVKKEIENLGS